MPLINIFLFLEHFSWLLRHFRNYMVFQWVYVLILVFWDIQDYLWGIKQKSMKSSAHNLWYLLVVQFRWMGQCGEAPGSVCGTFWGGFGDNQRSTLSISLELTVGRVFLPNWMATVVCGGSGKHWHFHSAHSSFSN